MNFTNAESLVASEYQTDVSNPKINKLKFEKDEFYMRRLFLIALLPIVFINFLTAAYAESEIVIDIGKAVSLNVPGTVTSVLIADEAIANVDSQRPGQFFIYGRNVGSTSLIAVDDNGKVILDKTIVVQHDIEKIRKVIRERFPKQDIKVFSSNGTILFKGQVPNQQLAQDIEATISPFAEGGSILNRLVVSTSDTVRLYVKLILVNDTKSRDLGIDWRSILDVGNIILNDTINTELIGKLSPTDFFSNGTAKIDDIIDILEERDVLTVLSEPSLATVSGASASLRSGGQFPVPKSTQVGNGNVTSGIDFQFFGVQLDFTPTIRSKNNIRLQVSAAVSDLQKQAGQIDGNELPFLNEQSFQTTVDLASGQSFVTAGLIKTNTSSADRIPTELRNSRFLNGIIGNKNADIVQTELIAIITPFLYGSDPNDDQDIWELGNQDKASYLPLIDYVFRMQAAGNVRANNLPLISGTTGFRF